MSLKALLISALAASVEARFGQEHPAAITEIADVTSGGQPGEAASIAGGAISDLLASANACAKYQTGDNIIASLGNGSDAVKAAQDFVHAEVNFNPFNSPTPTLCDDPALPSTAILRGILPNIDPAVVGSTLANQLANQSLTTPFPSTGMSVAQIFAANGFSNFTTEDLAGNKGGAPGNSGVGSAAASSSATGSSGPPSSSSSVAAAGGAGECSPVAPPAAASAASSAAATTLSTALISATPSSVAGSSSAGANLTGTAAQQAAEADPATGTSAKTSLGGEVDFGLCVPTIFLAGGLDNRPATEFTFQAVDPKISAIQEEALNPNIITNRICDELTNQCQSNQAAKNVCAQAKTQISGLGTRDQSTADAWNKALGF